MKIFGAVCFWIASAMALMFFGLGVVEIVKFAWSIDPRFAAGLFGLAVIAFGTIYHINRED
jgi:hypothetical protein